LPEECFEQVFTAISKPESLDLTLANKAFHKLLIGGVPVKYKNGDKIIHDQALLVDFENESNNLFYAVNQFTISGTKQPRRPDIICFINGLPIAVLELKSPNDENVDVWDAFQQIQTYKDEISDLLYLMKPWL
jgi:type I restriction enzyme R subunit